LPSLDRLATRAEVDDLLDYVVAPVERTG